MRLSTTDQSPWSLGVKGVSDHRQQVGRYGRERTGGLQSGLDLVGGDDRAAGPDPEDAMQAQIPKTSKAPIARGLDLQVSWWAVQGSNL